MKISDEAVDAAQAAWTKAYWTEATPGKDDWMRAALEAAAPYLAPAVPQPVDREALWHAIVDVRDASPRIPEDADSWDIVDAVLAVLAGEQEQAQHQ